MNISIAKSGFLKRISGDFLCSFFSVVMFFAVQQLVLYPLLNRWLGAETYGNFLFFMSLIAIVAIPWGSGLNTTRLLIRDKDGASNGDYTAVLLLYCGIALIAGVVLFPFWGHWSMTVPFGLLAAFTVSRYYLDVEYRLTLKYGQFFLFYLILSAGYLIGTGLLYFTKNWIWAVLPGEAAVLFFVLWKGHILGFDKGKQFRAILKKSFTFSFAGLLYQFVQNLDRVLIIFLIGAVANSRFYVISLPGKTVALLIMSLQNLFISYLTKMDRKLTVKEFSLIVCSILAGSIIVLLGCGIGTPIFTSLFYHNISCSFSDSLVWIANGAQIVLFASALLLTITYTLASEKWQFWINLFYAIFYLAAAIPAAMYAGLTGFAVAVLFVNTLRLSVSILLGYGAIFFNIRKGDTV